MSPATPLRRALETGRHHQLLAGSFLADAAGHQSGQREHDAAMGQAHAIAALAAAALAVLAKLAEEYEPEGLLELAERAYGAYGTATGNLNHLGGPMPPWGQLPGHIQEAWMAAAGVMRQ